MDNLETKISEWREKLKRAFPGDEETIRELEEHLRDDVRMRCRAGISADAAFEASVQRLGDAQAISREFGRVHASWLPTSRAILGFLAFIAVAAVVMVVFLGWVYANGRMTLLLFTHVVTATAGYLAMAGAGLLGVWALLTPFWRSLTATERRELRAAVFRLAVASSVLVPMGMVLGAVWAADNLGSAWSWDPIEVGAVLVLISSWLLLLARTRLAVDDRVCWLIAIVGGVGVDLQLGARAFHTVVAPWLCVALIFGQIAIVAFGLKRTRTGAAG